MRKNGFLASILAICCLCSCISGEHKILNTVSEILESRPDSALTLLQTLQADNLSKPSDKARYALLLSMALDKNYIDVTDDSLINIAVNYYARRKHSSQYMKACYMQGLIYKNGRRFPAAITALERAESIAVQIGDSHYLGLIERNIANVFNQCNNNISATEYHQKALRAFEENGDTRYANHAKYALAADYGNQRDYDNAERLLADLLESTDELYLRAHANLLYASILVQKNDSLETARILFDATPTKYYNLLDYGFLALDHQLLGAPKDTVDYWLNEGYKKCHSQAEATTLGYLESKINVRRNDYRKAYEKVDKALSVQDSLTRVLLMESLSHAQRDYYKQEYSLEKERNKRERLILILILASLVSVIVITVLIATIRNQRKDLLLKDSLARLSVSQKLNAKLTGAYVYEKMARLSTLAGSYFSSDNKKEQGEVLQAIKRSLSDIRESQEFFTALEEELNQNCNGLIQKLRSQVPAIKGDNLRIAMLSFAGFTNDAIMIIMNRPSTSSLKTLRSRLRSTIKNAGCQDETLFLDILSR